MVLGLSGCGAGPSARADASDADFSSATGLAPCQPAVHRQSARSPYEEYQQQNAPVQVIVDRCRTFEVKQVRIGDNSDHIDEEEAKSGPMAKESDAQPRREGDFRERA